MSRAESEHGLGPLGLDPVATTLDDGPADPSGDVPRAPEVGDASCDRFLAYVSEFCNILSVVIACKWR